MINITSSSDYVAFNPTSLLYLESNWASGIPQMAQWLSQNGRRGSPPMRKRGRKRRPYPYGKQRLMAHSS